MHKEADRLNKRMEVLRAQMAKMSVADVHTLRHGDPGQNIKGFREMVHATDAYRVSTVKAMSASEEYTKRLQKEKVKMFEHIKGQKLRNEALKEQYRLQRISVMGWTEDGNGNISGDAIIPRHVPERLTSFTKGLAEARAGTVQWGEVINENRMRVGLWAQSMRSASLNVVNLGKNTQWAGRQMMVGLSLPIAALAAASGTLAYNIDREMTRILKVYDYSTGEIEAQQERIKSSSMATAKTMARMYGQAAEDTLAITAELAAMGRTGNALQQSTAIVSQGMFLGELNQEDALKTAISLLTVFREEGETAAEGNIRLAESFAYMNALENATTLSMKDMTVAIPRLAGVVRLLGGDVQELGVLMAATSAAGIEPGQGANALKSVLFRGGAAVNNSKAGRTFSEATGIEIESITAQTQGKAIPTLIAIGEAYKNSNLNAVEQLRIVKELFGIWRGGAAEMVISQLLNINDATTNVGRAFQESQKDASEWAETARRETVALQSSVSGQFKLALETVKIELADMGEPFLKAATMILKLVSRIIGAFNDMGDGKKYALMLAAGFVAIIGPAVMLSGVILNLIGTMARYLTGLVQFASGFKLLNKEQKVAALVAGQARLDFMNEAQAVNGLNKAIAQLSFNMQKLRNEQMAANISQYSRHESLFLRNLKNGTTAAYVRDPKTKQINKANEIDIAGHREASHALALQDPRQKYQGMNAPGPTQEKQASRVAARLGGGAVATAGTIGLLVGGTNKWVVGLSTAAMLFGGMNVSGKALLVKQRLSVALEQARLGYIIKSGLAANALEGKIGGTATAAKTFVTTLLGSMAPIALIGTGLAAAAATLLVMKRNSDQAIESYSKLSDIARTSAELQGLAWAENNAAEGTEIGKQISLQQKLQDEYKDQIELLKEMDNITAGAEIRRIGLEVFEGTGSSDAAIATMEALANSARDGENIINIRLNFEDDPGELLRNTLRDTLFNLDPDVHGKSFMEKFMAGLASGGSEGPVIDISGKAEEAGERAGRDIVTTVNNMLSKGDTEGARQLMLSIQRDMEEHMNSLASGIEIKDEDKFKRMFGFSPSDADRMNALLMSKTGASRLVEGGFIDSTDARRIGEFAQLNEAVFRGFANEAGIARDSFTNFSGALKNTGAYKVAQDELKKTALNAKMLGTAARDAAGDVAGLGDAVDDAGEVAKAFADAQKGMMQNAWGSVLDEAGNQIERNHEASIDRMEAASERRLAALELEAEQAADDFDRRREEMQAAQKNEDKTFKKSWKNRTEQVESSFDRQVEAIEARMDKEREAEEARKKAFEAEKARIQRLADMYNQNINFNVALNTGELDEAAIIANNMRASQEKWGLEDAEAGAGNAFEATQKAAQARIKEINSEKDARIEALKEEEEAAKEALEIRQEQTRKALDNEKKMYDKLMDDRRKAENKSTDSAVKAAKDRYNAAKDSLDREMGALRAFVPRNQAELNAHVSNIEALYKKHGFQLDTQSKVWSEYVASAMRNATDQASVEMRENIKWDQLGRDIGAGLADNILGMTFPEFVHWMNTGEIPTALQPKAQTAPQNTRPVANPRQADRQSANRVANKAAITSRDRRIQEFHSGGSIGDQGSGRGGRPKGAKLYPDEVPIIAQRGEFIFQKKAVDAFGLKNLIAMNNGSKGPDNTGRMHQGGIVGGLGAVIQGFKKGLGKAMEAGAVRKAQELMAQGRNESVPTGLVAKMINANIPVQMNEAVWDRSTGNWPKAVRGKISANTLAAKRFIAAMWSSTNGGGAPDLSRGDKNSDHGRGKALDIFPGTRLGQYAKGDSLTEGNAIANWLVQNPSRFGTKYVIWQKQINSGGGWRNYSRYGDNPGPVLGHYDHVHASFRHGGGEIGSSMTKGLRQGGFTRSDGFAKLHKNEAVLTSPLTDSLVNGINNIDSGGNITYDIKMDFTGAVIREEIDIERAVNKVLNAHESKMGRKRVVGRA